MTKPKSKPSITSNFHLKSIFSWFGKIPVSRRWNISIQRRRRHTLSPRDTGEKRAGARLASSTEQFIYYAVSYRAFSSDFPGNNAASGKVQAAASGSLSLSSSSHPSRDPLTRRTIRQAAKQPLRHPLRFFLARTLSVAFSRHACSRRFASLWLSDRSDFQIRGFGLINCLLLWYL